MIIDFHTHLARNSDMLPFFPHHMCDVERFLAEQAAAGVGTSVLSYLATSTDTDPEALDDARQQHDFFAALITSHPGRFAALAGIDPFGGGPWLAEAERALEAGFSGLCLPTSSRGRYLDSDEAEQALALANDHGVVVFLHPAESPAGMHSTGDPILDSWIGRPYETGISVSRLLLADTLANYPRLRIVVAHAGAVVPMLLCRLDKTFETLTRKAAFAGRGGAHPTLPPGLTGTAVQTLRPALDRPPPSERLTQLYFDTAAHHAVPVRAAIDTVGADHVVLGSDSPPAGPPWPAVDIVLGLELGSHDRDDILFNNARSLLRPLPPQSLPAPSHSQPANLMEATQ